MYVNNVGQIEKPSFCPPFFFFLPFLVSQFININKSNEKLKENENKSARK